MIEIKVVCDWCSSETLEQTLATEITLGVDLRLSLRESSHAFRNPVGIDPTVLVAIVGGAGAAVSALIAGLLRVLEKKGKKAGATITLRGADGTKVVAPADATQEQLEQLVELAMRLNKPMVYLTTSLNDSEIS